MRNNFWTKARKILGSAVVKEVLATAITTLVRVLVRGLR